MVNFDVFNAKLELQLDFMRTNILPTFRTDLLELVLVKFSHTINVINLLR